MTIMYTIGIIIMSLAFTLSFYNILLMFERKCKVWLLPILVVIGTMLILQSTSIPRLDRYYGEENPHSYQDLFPEAYKEGYKKAIEDAVLIEVTDTSYTISFNGEDNFYIHSVPDADN